MYLIISILWIQVKKWCLFLKWQEWGARLLIEKSSAIKCPSISYHLVGTKKIQQELAKPNVLERFLNIFRLFNMLCDYFNDESIHRVCLFLPLDKSTWQMFLVYYIGSLISTLEMFVFQKWKCILLTINWFAGDLYKTSNI